MNQPGGIGVVPSLIIYLLANDADLACNYKTVVKNNITAQLGRVIGKGSLLTSQ